MTVLFIIICGLAAVGLGGYALYLTKKNGGMMDLDSWMAVKDIAYQTITNLIGLYETTSQSTEMFVKTLCLTIHSAIQNSILISEADKEVFTLTRIEKYFTPIIMAIINKFEKQKGNETIEDIAKNDIII